jgi:hypothetical protein
MQHSKWFPASLILNGFLIMALAAALNAGKKSAKPSPAKPPSSPVKFTAVVPLKKTSPEMSANALTPAAKMKGWIDQLRAAGAPDKLLAELIVADSEDRWQSREHELQKKYEKGDLDDKGLADSRDGHEAEQENELRTMLGDNAFRKFDREKVLADMDLAKLNLSDSELDTLYQLRKDNQNTERDLERSQRNGEIDESDMADRQAEAQTIYDEQLKLLLGERYALTRPSDDDAVAGNMKRTLKGMNVDVSDDQLNALALAQQQWNQQCNKLDPADPNYSQQLSAADTARDTALEKVLGANGLAQFKMEQDGHYQTMKKFATVWQLNDQDMDQVYQTLHSYEASVRDYQQKAHAMESQGQAVDWEGVQANIQQYAQQTKDTLRNYLGIDRFNRMKKNEFFGDMISAE